MNKQQVAGSAAEQSVRQTKVVATLGPASDDLVGDLIGAGVDVFRLNFSHGSHAEHAERIRRIREAAGHHERFVAILADLQGPKIRITGFARGGAVELAPGQTFTVDTRLAADQGSAERVGTTRDRKNNRHYV